MRVVIDAGRACEEEIRSYLRSVERLTGTRFEICRAEDMDWEEYESDAADRQDAGLILDARDFSRNLPERWPLFRKIFVFGFLRLWCEEDIPFLAGKMKELEQAGDLEQCRKVNELVLRLEAVSDHTIVASRPIEMQLESTSVCNLHCIMCEHFYSDNRGCGSLALQTLKTLESSFPYIREIFIHGLGEPFLYEHMEEMLTMFDRFGIRVSCNSNLTRLPEKLIPLVRATFHGISISCDGADEDMLALIRRGAGLDELREHAALLRREAPNVGLRMSTVAMRQNLGQLADIVRLACQMGCHSITISLMTPNPVIGNELDSPLCYPLHARQAIDAAVREGELVGVEVVVPDMEEITDDAGGGADGGGAGAGGAGTGGAGGGADAGGAARGAADLSRQEKARRQYAREEEALRRLEGTGPSRERCLQTLRQISPDHIHLVRDITPEAMAPLGDTCSGICNFLLTKPYIDHNGDGFACCINPTYRLGRIGRDGSLEDIWNNENYQALRRIFRQGRIPGCCRGCQFIVNHTLSMIGGEHLTEEYYRKTYAGDQYQAILRKIRQSRDTQQV